MAIQNRRGLYTELDKSKLLPGEFAFVTGQGEETEGELYFCYAAGKVKRCATKEDIELILATSPASYEALQKLIDDLESNPSELTNILNNIIQLQSIVSDLQEVKIDKTEKGAVNGVATLGEDGKVPNVQLPEIPMSAIDITYDNTESGMEALNTQDAIDELSQETIFLAGETERLDAEKIDEAEKGVADGIATLDSTGKIPLTQIPDGIGGDNLISGKRFTSFGDSITYRNLWQPHIIERFGLIHTNCGIGSTKVAGAVNATYPCFWEPSRISAVQASNPDIVTILGGANDWSGNIAIGTDAEFTKVLGSKDKTTFKGAYSYIIETLLAWKPSLAIILLTTTWGDSEALNSLSLANRDYAKATKEVAWYYGLLCVDLRGEMGLNAITSPYLLVDTVHPNEIGAERMAKCIIEKFKMISLDFIATKIYYYNLGNELTSWSTGINSNSGGTVSNTKNSNNLSMTATVSGTGAANIGYSSDSKVNLANINTLYFDAEVTLTGASGKFLVGLDPNGRTDSNTYYSDLIVGVSSSGRQIYSINTSNITDSRYIKLIASSGNTSSSTVKVYKIWGE